MQFGRQKSGENPNKLLCTSEIEITFVEKELLNHAGAILRRRWSINGSALENWVQNTVAQIVIGFVR